MNIEELTQKAELITLKKEEIKHLKQRGNLSKLLFEAYEKKDFEEFFKALCKHYQIKEIHEDIKSYIRLSANLKKIKGAACLKGMSEYIDQKLRPFEGFLNNFPALYLHSDIWVMLHNAKVVTLHHEATFYELAFDIEEKVENREQFLERFSGEGSFLTFKDLLKMNYFLLDKNFKGCWNYARGMKECKLLLQSIKFAKGLIYEELAGLVNLNTGSGYLYEVAMEFYEALENKDVKIQDIENLED